MLRRILLTLTIAKGPFKTSEPKQLVHRIRFSEPSGKSGQVPGVRMLSTDFSETRNYDPCTPSQIKVNG